MQKSAAHVLKTSAVAERFAGRRLQTYASSPTEFDRYLRGEVDKWARLVKAARIGLD